METHFEFPSAAADATLPYTSLRARSRKQAGPTKFIAAGAADGADSGAPGLGASSSSAPAPEAGTHDDFSAMAGISKWYGFVKFSSESEAATALEKMSDQVLDGKDIRVHYANSGRYADVSAAPPAAIDV